jgi:hypothetical protein
VDPSQYGPFANIVAAASALVATFSVLLLKAVGTVKRWTWMGSGSPLFLVTAGARVLAVALMAVTYVTIDKSNFGWYAGAAVLAGFFGFLAIARFDRLSRLHVVPIPLVGKDGQPLRGRKNETRVEYVVIGLEKDLREDAKAALNAARAEKGGLSVRQFMSGYGAQRLNDPEALWDRELLAAISSKLTITLMSILLFGVMAVFLAAFTIEVVNR